MDPIACIVQRIIGARGADRREALEDLATWYRWTGFRPTAAAVVAEWERAWSRPFPSGARRTLRALCD